MLNLENLTEILTSVGDFVPPVRIYCSCLLAYKQRFGGSLENARKVIEAKTAIEIMNVLKGGV